MEITRIEGCTRTIGESQGYLGLPLRDIVINCTVNGLNTPAMETAWRPNVEDIDAMVGGAPIVLRILGTQHPPVMLTVTPRSAEEIAAAETKAAQLKEIDKATNPAAFAGSDDELAQTAAMLENMAEASFPATNDGKFNFARVVMETAAQCIRAHLKATDCVGVTDAARDVLAERSRQVSAEGWTPEHDDKYKRCEITEAAACYAAPWAVYWGPVRGAATLYWPWSRSWWKPSDDRRRDLVKSGALILAEIERLDRAALIASALVAQGGKE